MISIRTLTCDDLPSVKRLKEQAGWNQTDADLRRFRDLAREGFFLAELDGQPVGTAAAFIFGEEAWIALVLVDSAYRGRGIGTALMEHALKYLEQSEVKSIRLDATPLGRPIYEKLGFVAEYELARYEGTLPPREPVAEVEDIAGEHLAPILRLDHEVTRAWRLQMLIQLYVEQPTAFRIIRREGKLLGYLTSRPGSRATHLGPCIAEPEAGPLLFADAQHRLAGQLVYIDIPLANAAARAFPEGLGWKIQRHLLRMGKGPRVQEDVSRLWASSGPEKG